MTITTTPIAAPTTETSTTEVGVPPAPHSRSAAVRSRRDSVAAIPNALASEWTKLRSLRSNRAILGGTGAIGIVLAWVLAVFVKIDPDTNEVFTIGNTFIFSTWLSAVLSMVTGTLMFTGEVQHGTLAASITAQPARWVTVAAKSTIAAAFGLAMGVVGMIGGLSGTVLGGLERGDASGMTATAAWGLMLTTVAAVFGLGIGMIVRHSATAISMTLVWAFVLENLFRAFAPATATRFLPFSAANGLLNIQTTSDPEALAQALTRIHDALLFGAYTMAALAVGTVLLYRRDAN